MSDNNCKATIRFADDYGDNEATFHCELQAGHRGRHRESGMLYETLPYAVEWEGQMADSNEEAVTKATAWISSTQSRSE